MRTELDNLLREALNKLIAEQGFTGLPDLEADLERTRDSRHGDFTTNVAMRLAKAAQRAPRDLASALVALVPASPLIAKVEIAGPGFVNFTLAPHAYRAELRAIVAKGADYGHSAGGAGTHVLVEYLSANPTGPLHVGHGRLAAYGATLSNILRAAGFTIDEEYYVNDAGRQMDILAASVWLRYAELCGQPLPFPGNAYQGDYVRDVAAQLRRDHGETLLGDAAAVRAALATADATDEQRLDLLIAAIKQTVGTEIFLVIHSAGLDSVLDDIKQDLEEFGVVPQRWYSERSLTESGAVERALGLLRERGMLYERDGATWFRSTDYGDDKDRVVIRENGATTYFASDIAYHLEKRERGYDLLLNVLGADHHGYVTRVRAGLQAMGQPGECLEVQLVQFVVLFRGQVKVQMSTRSGEYVTLRALREEVGNDAARFFYVSRSNDQHLEFDLELAKRQSNDNPVYYVQYAHARVASMLRRLQENNWTLPTTAVNLDLLTAPKEHALTVALSRYPEVVQLAADNRAPQHLVHYLRDTAATFHSCYDEHRILVEEQDLREARVFLALAAQQVLKNALNLLGVAAPLNM
ncbi:MAG TPA: arginine--tRNA ligase [Gammaproteobacteria bacterium]|nr:arginine--tRNA ligase [Gammaproteobacteria bacterium]